MTIDTECFCKRLKNELTFHFLGHDDIRTLSDYLDCRQVPGGEVLWKVGDPCEYLAFIASGRVEVSKPTEFPGKNVIVGIYGAGSIVGELCLLKEQPRKVNVGALEATDLLMLSKEMFTALMEEHPEVGGRLLKGMLLTVSTRLDKAFERLTAVF